MMEEYKKMRTCLPPGLQFHPTDEELVLCFLYYKAARLSYNYLDLIPDLDICLADPQHDQLKEKAFVSETEQYLYFFSRSRQNRSTGNGLWKELGYVDPISTSGGVEIGSKIYLGFYADDEVRFNWIMEEYHLSPTGLSAIYQLPENQIQDCNEWVLCRVHEASVSNPENKNNGDDDDVLSYLDQVYLSMEDDIDDDQEEITFPI